MHTCSVILGHAIYKKSRSFVYCVWHFVNGTSLLSSSIILDILLALFYITWLYVKGGGGWWGIVSVSWFGVGDGWVRL